jgi:hypothetical protein
MHDPIQQTNEVEFCVPALPGYGIEPATARRYLEETHCPENLRAAARIFLRAWERWHMESVTGPCGACAVRKARWDATRQPAG